MCKTGEQEENICTDTQSLTLIILLYICPPLLSCWGGECPYCP